METDQRTVAEIMGWARPRNGWWTTDECDDWMAGQGYGGYVHGPTPDDMLAWLVSQDGVETIQTSADAGGCAVNVWWSFQSWSDKFDAPTLHAALEAAVRAVAEAS